MTDEGVKALVEEAALEAVRLQLRRDGYRVPNAALLLALDRAGFTLARPRLQSDNARLREALKNILGESVNGINTPGFRLAGIQQIARAALTLSEGDGE